jgi:hypothetical protein
VVAELKDKLMSNKEGQVEVPAECFIYLHPGGLVKLGLDEVAGLGSGVGIRAGARLLAIFVCVDGVDGVGELEELYVKLADRIVS